MVEVVDDYLSEINFNKLKKEIFGHDFKWKWFDAVAYPKDNEDYYESKSHLPYLSHVIYRQPAFFTDAHKIIVENFDKDKFQIKALLRIKVNCYLRGNVLEEHGMHVDFDFKHKGALFALNTCDGYTRFESGEKVDSVANRMIFFNPNIKHTSSNTTNVNRRVNINFNYF